MIFFGLYLARVIGTKVLPKEPVPPVMRMVLLVNIQLVPWLSQFYSEVKTGCIG
ncbi:hypothetical protein D3C85_1888450 [compost metagenome]